MCWKQLIEGERMPFHSDLCQPLIGQYSAMAPRIFVRHDSLTFLLEKKKKILDPIDGTRGFVRGGDALYVVGLALVVEGEIVLGVMGCPNWQEDNPSKSTKEALESANTLSESGIIMVSHIGCGTWTKQLSGMMSSTTKIPNNWARCSVDSCCLVHEARFCSLDGQTWDSLPLSTSFDATTDAESINDKLVLLLPACCGSLCKYLMVACGRASVFVLRKRAQTIVQNYRLGIMLLG